MAEASRTSDWKSPQLAWHATGQALDAISHEMYAEGRAGLVTRGSPEGSPRVIRADPAADPASVLLSDCRVDSRRPTYRQRNGELGVGKPRRRQAITAEVTKQDSGEWKVTRFADEGVGSC
ncbi:hypothetical protein ABZ916_24505 [Streptomyces sp. NPDC046853]|uniref:hypothetical protein n=1 Tax=Streptomyces sp. NPDC046853 TaxID=3154920 RepID=UPI0033EC75F8